MCFCSGGPAVTLGMSVKVLGYIGLCRPVPAVKKLVFVNDRVEVFRRQFIPESFIGKGEFRRTGAGQHQMPKKKKEKKDASHSLQRHHLRLAVFHDHYTGNIPMFQAMNGDRRFPCRRICVII